MPDSSLVYIRYLDHVLFKNINPEGTDLQIREAVGWLTEENEDFVKIELERTAPPSNKNRKENGASSLISANRISPNQQQQSTGLVILKSSILEMEELSR